MALTANSTPARTSTANTPMLAGRRAGGRHEPAERRIRMSTRATSLPPPHLRTTLPAGPPCHGGRSGSGRRAADEKGSCWDARVQGAQDHVLHPAAGPRCRGQAQSALVRPGHAGADGRRAAVGGRLLHQPDLVPHPEDRQLEPAHRVRPAAHRVRYDDTLALISRSTHEGPARRTTAGRALVRSEPSSTGFLTAVELQRCYPHRRSTVWRTRAQVRGGGESR